MKLCTKCGTTKSEDQFHKRVGNKDGLDGWCKECKQAYGRGYRKKNAEKVKRQKSEYFQKNKVKIRQRINSRYEKDCEHCHSTFLTGEEIQKFCSRDCWLLSRGAEKHTFKPCEHCGEYFLGGKTKKYCSRECANQGRKGRIPNTAPIRAFNALAEQGLKKCPKCEKIKPLSGYHLSKDRPLGVTSRCKECVNEDFKEKYRENPEKYREEARRWKEKNPDGYRKMLARRDPQKIVMNGRRYVARNREKIRRQERERYYKNHEENLAKNHIQRAKRRKAFVEPVNLDDIYERDCEKCQICGRKVERGFKGRHPMMASLDHIIPIHKGGLHVAANVQLSHLKCNLTKNRNLILDKNTFKAMTCLNADKIDRILQELLEIKRELQKGRKVEGLKYPLFEGEKEWKN